MTKRMAVSHPQGSPTRAEGTGRKAEGSPVNIYIVLPVHSSPGGERDGADPSGTEIWCWLSRW